MALKAGIAIFANKQILVEQMVAKKMALAGDKCLAE